MFSIKMHLFIYFHIRVEEEIAFHVYLSDVRNSEKYFYWNDSITFLNRIKSLALYSYDVYLLVS